MTAEEFFQAELLAAWHSVPAHSRPPQVWLRQHTPFDCEPDTYRIPTPVQAAWLLRDGRITPKPVSEFLRFYVVQSDRIWSSADLPPPSPLFDMGAHEFALSSFAGISGTSDYFFQWQFAGLHGRADRYHHENGVFTPADNLWIS
ncbi:MAG: hypothetical protein JWM59_2569 [Verrucomicrobiales bacterium]|nr:hypothetical protein [Verrucomicrobiales bacterium]